MSHDNLMTWLTVAITCNSIILAVVAYLMHHVLSDVKERVVRLENNFILSRSHD